MLGRRLPVLRPSVVLPIPLNTILPLVALTDSFVPTLNPALASGSIGTFTPNASPLPRRLILTVSTRFADTRRPRCPPNTGTGLRDVWLAHTSRAVSVVVDLIPSFSAICC